MIGNIMAVFAAACVLMIFVGASENKLITFIYSVWAFICLLFMWLISGGDLLTPMAWLLIVTWPLSIPLCLFLAATIAVATDVKKPE